MSLLYRLTPGWLVLFVLGLVTVNAGPDLHVEALQKNPSPQTNEARAMVDQLPAVSGIVPVEIQYVQLSSNNSGESVSVSYLVRNNTHKGITAFGIERNITYEDHGKLGRSTHNDTTDLELISELFEKERKKISPGEFKQMESGEYLSFGDGTVIKEIGLRISFVEFDDGSLIGADSEGSRQVKAIRDGATRYKYWLSNQYIQRGRSLSTVLTLLQEDELPGELRSMNMGEQMGAKAYRGHLLKIYQTVGAAKVEQYLKHQ